jgi:hypothetical protein
VGKFNLEMCSEDCGSIFPEIICTCLTITDFMSQNSLIFILSTTKLKNFEDVWVIQNEGENCCPCLVESNCVHVLPLGLNNILEDTCIKGRIILTGVRFRIGFIRLRTVTSDRFM